MIEAEIWKDIKDYETRYEVSNFGNVRSKTRVVSDRKIPRRVFKARQLKPWVMGTGYASVSLSKEGRVKKFTVHHLVCSAFHERSRHHQCVNHKDGDKVNNHHHNLEWCTQKENNDHAFKTGLRKAPPQFMGGKGHITYKGDTIATNISDGSKITLFGAKDMRDHGFNSKSVYSCISGKRKSHKGYRFERINEA
jgi:hypothetical protein